MFNRFDILKKLADGGIVWIEGVADLETARERIKLFAAQKPGEYVVFSQETQALIEQPWVPYTASRCFEGQVSKKKTKRAKTGETPQKDLSGANTAQTVAKIVADIERTTQGKKMP